MSISNEEVVQRLTKLAFGNPLISNIYRGLVAEVIVGSALSSNWKHCSEDWKGWDFEHNDGTRFEVKQSAVLQSWSSGEVSASRFSIAPSTGFFTGNKWTANPGRQSSIYIFAHHDNSDRSQADHRDPLQWTFYVVPASLLPTQKTISLDALAKVVELARSQGKCNHFCPCDITHLGKVVDTLHASTTV